ncbi:unnamed protein product, partial [Linum tenue]
PQPKPKLSYFLPLRKNYAEGGFGALPPALSSSLLRLGISAAGGRQLCFQFGFCYVVRGLIVEMSMSGLAVAPTKCGARAPGLSTSGQRVLAVCSGDRTREKNIGFLPLQSSAEAGQQDWCEHSNRGKLMLSNALWMLPMAEMVRITNLVFMNLLDVVFPRIHVRDPYKRLGISREASEDEIQGARNFLIQRYGGHKPSVDAIETAHDKIIMQKFYDRKNPKIDINKKVREVKQSRFVQAVTNRFRTPSTSVIVKTTVAFLVLGALTVLFPTEEGPTLQVAISLVATMYFIYDRLNSRLRATLYGVAAFIFSWLLGTFLMVSIIPPVPIIKGPRSFEVITSLLTYVLLWISSTYLK